MKKLGGTIKNWRIAEGLAYGDVHGSPEFSNGEAIHTSEIQQILIITRNSIYSLDPREQQGSDLKRFVGTGVS